MGFVEDEFFDEDAVFEERLRRWCGLGSGFGRGLFGGQKRVEELEVVEEFAGAAEIPSLRYGMTSKGRWVGLTTF